MPRYNPQWEDQIKGYRKNRVLLVAKSLPFSATTTQVESAIRARLTKPDSVTFLWPPGATRPNHHIGWVMLAFSRRPNTKMALEELQNFEILGRAVNVERAHRHARLPNPSYGMSAARNSASVLNAAISTTTTTAANSSTTAAATATPASAVSTAAPSVQPAPTEDTTASNASDSLEEKHVPSRDFEWWW
ncbi:hypothetical protein TRIATDRAFT_308060 [Trichoderma atroviride IMI 206040]|uniref:RRM domain-containing protein n=1 Tax=Hypocrea atroviridis (strain ATCC 20476 / IMI 206040) TaxID=452589 RepID=G9NTK8_HYPAI|nr:uncharacterized protein TRIATDRAFT_308060 [Trichoderma atroviride IMI 206040]EHK46049.1 hypothetical protein TRIATDRAFT_308060 [Trichoderma atroviride IMI 206040]